MMDHTRHGITADIDKNLATWGFKKKKAKVNHYIEFCASFSQIGIIPKITQLVPSNCNSFTPFTQVFPSDCNLYPRFTQHVFLDSLCK